MPGINEQNSTTAGDLASEIPKIYSKKVYHQAMGKMYWERFSGDEGSGMPIIVKSELISEPGDKIQITQLQNLPDDSGVQGEETLTGNEQKLSPRSVEVTPEWRRNGVSNTTKAKSQITWPFREKARIVLGNWMAKKRDNEIWSSAQVTGEVGWEKTAVNGILPSAGFATVDDLDPTAEFNVDMIRNAVAILESADVARISIPGMTEGDGYYLCFINPFQALSLRKDADWIANHQAAGQRGEGNPLFTSALGEIAGCILHSTTQCDIFANAAATPINCATAIMIGAEAICTGEGDEVEWIEETQDYGFKQGIAISGAWGSKILSANAIIKLTSVALKP